METVIYTSRVKSIGFLLLSIAFVGTALFLLLLRPEYINTHFEYIMLIVAVVFFGIGIPLFLYRIFFKNATYILKKEWLHIVQQGVLVKWEDIVKFQKVTVHSTEVILIILRNPEEYIYWNNALTKGLSGFMHQLYGTPLCLYLSGMKKSPKEIMDLLERYKKGKI